MRLKLSYPARDNCLVDKAYFPLYNHDSATVSANGDGDMAKRVTMHDVAQAAGVSLMTVSRVVNDKEDVSLETRQRVMQIIEQLNYRPSSIARGLATHHTGTLGIVVPDISNPFFASIVRNAEEEAYAQDYSVFLGNTNEDPQREQAVLQSLEDNQVDGLILCSSRLEDDTLFDFLDRFPTTVMVFRRRKRADVGAITLDDVFGGQLAIEHLIHTGHRNIGLISGPPISLSSFGRLEGYQTALCEAQIAINENWIRRCHPGVEAGQDTALELLKSNPELTALFCHNDLVAVGALQACAMLGLRVPDDIAIIGYDDIRLAGLVSPSLTTLRIPRTDIGTQAMQMLLRQIADDSVEPEEFYLQPELILRESAP
jgi:LacI family transcriptional regulator